MILQILERFSPIIKNYEIEKFRTNGPLRELVLSITFRNKSILFVRDYLFSDHDRKYSFHWQNEKCECLYRWDNAPHYQKTKSFPHHIHIGKTETVKDSQSMTLEKVLTFIDSCLWD